MAEHRLSLDDPRPPYIQIAEHLRMEIKNESLAPGQKLGSVRALADQYEVSPGTIQQALKLLREEGLIVSWQGRGVFVRNPAYDSEGDKTQGAAITLTHLDVILERVEKLETQVASLEEKEKRRR